MTTKERPYQKERLEQLKREIKEQGAVEAATLETLSQAKEDLNQLKYQLDYVLSLGAREEAKGSLASTAHLVALEGWMKLLNSML